MKGARVRGIKRESPAAQARGRRPLGCDCFPLGAVPSSDYGKPQLHLREPDYETKADYHLPPALELLCFR